MKMKKGYGLLIVSMILVAVIGIFNIASAGFGFSWDVVMDKIADKIVGQVSQDDSFGADVGDSTYLNTKRPATVVPFENVYIENDLEIDGELYLGSDTDIYGILDFSNTTTTPSKYSYAPLVISVTQSATSTDANPEVGGYWCNTGSPVYIDGNWFFDVQTANGLWGTSWTVGTTTCLVAGSTCGTGGVSFTNTTTASLATIQVSTSTTGIFDRYSIYGYAYGASLANAQNQNDGTVTTTVGTFYVAQRATTSPILIGNGTCVVVTPNVGGATSTASWTSAGGWTTFVGKFVANLLIK